MISHEQAKNMIVGSNDSQRNTHKLIKQLLTLKTTKKNNRRCRSMNLEM